MRQLKEVKKNYAPEHWLVVNLNGINLDVDRAKKLQYYRNLLNEKYGSQDERVNINNMKLLAIDLLLNYFDEVFSK